MKLRYCALMLGIFSCTSVVADSTITELAVPCAQSSSSTGSGYLRSCSEVISGSSNPNAPQGMIAAISAQVKKNIADPSNSLYAGGFNENGISANTGTPVCDLTPNSYDGNQSEAATNHLGQSCGNPAYIQVNASDSGIQSTMNVGGSNATMEFAYLRGVKAQAVACYAQKYINQIQQTQQISISPYCEAQAQAVQGLISKGTNAASSAQNTLSSMANIKDIWNCDPSMFGTGSNLSTSRPMQSAQHLCAARGNIEAAFEQVALCEIKNQAERAFRSIASNPDSYLNGLSQVLTPKINQQCTSACNGCSSFGCCSQAATQCANNMYKAALQQHMQNILANFPNNGSCAL